MKKIVRVSIILLSVLGCSVAFATSWYSSVNCWCAAGINRSDNLKCYSNGDSNCQHVVLNLNSGAGSKYYLQEVQSGVHISLPSTGNLEMHYMIKNPAAGDANTNRILNIDGTMYFECHKKSDNAKVSCVDVFNGSMFKGKAIDGKSESIWKKLTPHLSFP